MSSRVHVNKPLSSRMIIELLDDNPDLEVIECPQSLYERTSETYIDALRELGIEVKVLNHRGRPKKYDNQLINNINDMINSGIKPKTIAKRLHISQKTVYYLKSKKLKQGPPSKYSDEIKREIVKLKSCGIPVKSISDKLNIPIRTIYYILERERELLLSKQGKGV